MSSEPRAGSEGAKELASFKQNHEGKGRDEGRPRLSENLKQGGDQEKASSGSVHVDTSGAASQQPSGKLRHIMGDLTRATSRYLDANYTQLSLGLRFLVVSSALVLVYKRTSLFTRFRDNTYIPEYYFKRQKRINVKVTKVVESNVGAREDLTDGDIILQASHQPIISLFLPSFLNRLLFREENSRLTIRLFGVAYRTAFMESPQSASTVTAQQEDHSTRLENVLSLKTTLLNQPFARVQLLYIDDTSTSAVLPAKESCLLTPSMPQDDIPSRPAAGVEDHSLLVCKLFHRRHDRVFRTYLNRGLLLQGIGIARTELPGQFCTTGIVALRSFNKELDQFHDLQHRFDRRIAKLVNPNSSEKSFWKRIRTFCTFGRW